MSKPKVIKVKFDDYVFRAIKIDGSALVLVDDIARFIKMPGLALNISMADNFYRRIVLEGEKYSWYDEHTYDIYVNTRFITYFAVNYSPITYRRYEAKLREAFGYYEIQICWAVVSTVFYPLLKLNADNKANHQAKQDLRDLLE